MVNKKDNQQRVPTRDDIFRERANNYLVCFIDQCPLCSKCLRYLVGQYAVPDRPTYLAANPRNPQVGNEQCILFREDVRVTMKKGFKNMYLDMPGRMEKAIRRELIAWLGRNEYFQMRRGDRLITPEDQQLISSVCRKHGWNAPIVYDGEQEDFVW